MPAAKKEKLNSETMEICSLSKVKEAVNALKLLNKKFVKEDMKKQPLLDDTAESPIYLQLMLKKIPPPQLLQMIRVLLPHSLVAETSEVCLITGDLEKRNHKAEIEPTVLHYKDLLKKHGVTKVSQVIPLRQLRTEYKTFESKRQLAAAYDVFLVDKKIAGVMAKTLGKQFFHSRKFPVQIDLKRPNLRDQINKALCQTEFSLTCRGNSYALEIARLSMEDEAIIDNIKICIEVLEKKLPGNKENILSLYLKTAKSKAIPVYVSLDIPDKLLIKKPRKNDKCKFDELSTIDNAEVKVFRDGRVVLRKMKELGSCEEDAVEKDQKMDLNESLIDDNLMESEEDTQESMSTKGSLKKSKKKKKVSHVIEIANNSEMENEEDIQDSAKASRKKKRKSKKSADLVEVTTNTVLENEEDNQDSTNKVSPKKKKKGKKYADVDETTDIVEIETEDIQDSVTAEISPKKKKKGRKSILDQDSNKTEMKNEEETQNSPSSHIFSKKKNKKNRNASYVETDEVVEDIQEISMLFNSKKQKLRHSDVTEKSQKDKKRKFSESEDNDKIDTNMKSRKGKKDKDVDSVKKESSFISVEGGEITHDDKTPLRSKKNKKESTENTTASDSLMAEGKRANVVKDVNNSLVKLNKRKSGRKSLSVF